MKVMHSKLSVKVSTTPGGKECVRIASEDMVSVNVTLAADEISLEDKRKPAAEKK